VARIGDFLRWQLISEVAKSVTTLEDKLILYFEENHNAKKVDGSGEGRFAPTTLRGWFSMFVRFWQLTGKGNLHVLVPIIEINLMSWESTYESTSAKALTKQDYLTLYSLSSTDESLSIKFFCVLAIHIAGRKWSSNAMINPIFYIINFVYAILDKCFKNNSR